MISVGAMLSIDEEWSGWTGFLLNPYLVGPYVLLSVATAVSVRMSRLIPRVDGERQSSKPS